MTRRGGSLLFHGHRRDVTHWAAINAMDRPDDERQRDYELHPDTRAALIAENERLHARQKRKRT